jgi:hypothetical protein
VITREALYDFIQTVIDASDVSDALNGAEVFRNLRTSVDEAEKVVRVEVLAGQHCMSEEDVRKEIGVQATIQSWVKPDLDAGDEQQAIDDATDLSFEMSREIFRAIAGDPGLDGRVCDSSFEEFETGEANLGGRRGVTYLDGIINVES